ncbi:MAG TPA: metal-binding protein [Propionibacteriaceae bacterium]|nr:DUF177 domain-containing protein [Micropruina sp.]HBX82831.1 metal-binding protein [Propionibacteriaceae bacterium]HBY23421.1 metal-binding protein [Propionibacteriaceae bacterium]
MNHRLPDSHSGFVIDTHELGRRAGAMKTIERVVDAPEGIGIDMIGVPTGSPVTLDLQVESVVEGILVTGTGAFSLTGECARCLREVTSSDEVDLQELFVFPGKEDDDPEASRVEGDFVDLEPVFRDAVVLNLPFTPLCRPDCLGMCPQCGFNLNDDPGHNHGEQTDPRWAGLAGWQDTTNPGPRP